MPLWARLAVIDISVRYKRSVLGPFWITLTMLIFVVSVGLLYSGLFSQPAGEFMHFLAVGLVFWQFFSACLVEGSSALFGDKDLLLNTRISPFDIIMRVVARNFIIMLHNMPIVALTMMITWPVVGSNFFGFLLGAILVVVNGCWIAFVLSILSARFRDIPPLTVAIAQLMFILSPIIWTPAVLPAKSAFVAYNPIAYIIDAGRSPLLDSGTDYSAIGMSALFAAVGSLIAYLIYRRFCHSIAYWV